MPVYHYYATAQVGDSVAHIDGVTHEVEPITTYDAYAAFKQSIRDYEALQGRDIGALTVRSLTVIAQ